MTSSLFPSSRHALKKDLQYTYVYHWTRQKALSNIKDGQFTPAFIEYCKDNESLAMSGERGVLYVAARPQDSAQYVIKSTGEHKKDPGENPVLLEIAIPVTSTRTMLGPTPNPKDVNWYSLTLNQDTIKKIEVKQFSGYLFDSKELAQEKEQVVTVIENVYKEKNLPVPQELMDQVNTIMSPVIESKAEALEKMKLAKPVVRGRRGSN